MLPARADVRLEPWGPGDLVLLHRLIGDARLREYLSPPETPAEITARQARYLAHAERDPIFRVVDATTGRDAGWVGYWEREWRGVTVFETGWVVLPEWQGRGVATGAMRLVVDAARADGRHRWLHAFPDPANGPSNGVARSLGFALLGESPLEYPAGSGQVHPAHDWRLDLAPAFAVREIPPAATRGLRQQILRPHESLDELATHEPPAAAAYGAFAPSADDEDGDPGRVGVAAAPRDDAAAAVPDADPVAVGFAGPDGETPGGWRIRGMAAAEAVRGQGAGTAVLDALVSHALQQGAERIWCNARTPARSLYERAGFTASGDEFTIDPIGPHYVMERGRPTRSLVRLGDDGDG